MADERRDPPPLLLTNRYMSSQVGNSYISLFSIMVYSTVSSIQNTNVHIPNHAGECRGQSLQDLHRDPCRILCSGRPCGHFHRLVVTVDIAQCILLHTSPDITVGAITYYLVMKLKERRREREADLELQRAIGGGERGEGRGEGGGGARELELPRESGSGRAVGAERGRGQGRGSSGLGQAFVREGARVVGRGVGRFVFPDGKINIFFSLILLHFYKTGIIIE